MKWYSKLCTDLGEEHLKQREEQVPKPWGGGVLVMFKKQQGGQRSSKVSMRRWAVCLEKESGTRSYVWALAQQHAGPNSDWLWSIYCSVKSCWKLEIGHGERMHTTIKCYKSGLSTPENLLLSIYQHTTACRCGEKFVLIGIGGHQRGFELGTNVIWFLFNKITVEDRPQGFRNRSREMD